MSTAPLIPGGLTYATATAAKSSGTVAALIGDTAVTIRVTRDLAVAANDVLLVGQVGSQWWAFGRAGEAAVTPPTNDAAPPPKQTASGSLVITPVETRSYRPNFGWRTDNTDVYQGEYGGMGNHTGMAFYGTKARSLAGATVTSARIRVRRVSGGTYAAQATTMRLSSHRTRPAGAPSLGATTSGPSLAVGATNDSFAIPNSWAQDMVDGGSGSIAFFDADGSPYVRFAGRGTWSPAFTLTIRWQR
jgi:hypothetical protein